MLLRSIATLLLVTALPGFLGGRRRRPLGYGKELNRYRLELGGKTERIDEVLTKAAQAVDELRRRAIDPEEASTVLQLHEDELDATAMELEDMLAPEELHGLHMEYEANLERALRGIVTAQRGISITRLPHRPLEDEEPFNYWKRAEQNIVHAQMRLREVVAVLLAWEPGKPAEVSVTTRLHRA
jgi:hypothetical protein